MRRRRVICWESERGSEALESLTLRVRAAALNIVALNLARALNGHKGLMRGLQTSCIATANSGLRARQVGMKGRLPFSVPSGLKLSATGRWSEKLERMSPRGL